MERCKHEMIASQCGSCKALQDKLFPPKAPVMQAPKFVPIIRRRAVVEEAQRIAQAIRRADEYLGDVMGQMAEQEHSEEGGALGMIEGAFDLSAEDIRVCMFEALFTAGIKEEEVDLLKVVDVWYGQRYK